MYPLPQCLWPPDSVEWWLASRGSYSYSHMTLWLSGLVRSPDKLKSFLYYHSAYDHQNWQGGDIKWGGPTYNVTCSVNPVVLRSHMTNKICIPTCFRPISWQSGDLPRGLLPIKSHSPLNTCSHKITWRIKNIFTTTTAMASKPA